MAKEEITIDTIIKKYKALNNKSIFVDELAKKLGMNADYLRQNYFQGKCKIPADKMEYIDIKLNNKIAEQIEELKAI